MDDNSCVAFLRWALPHLHLRWHGFRRVRRQVCRRIDQRIATLGLSSIESYPSYLEKNPEEWAALDRLCRITISRFYRDRDVFDYLGSAVLPALTQSFDRNRNGVLRVWSAGCASGEEAYTVAILWHYSIRLNNPCPQLEIIATDSDPTMIRRATEACYPLNSLRNLPAAWTAQAFEQKNGLYCLRRHIQKYVRFELLDIRAQSPPGMVHVLFCRNLAFTYFDADLQQLIVRKLLAKIEKGGALIIGKHETIPPGTAGLELWNEQLPIYRKT